MVAVTLDFDSQVTSSKVYSVPIEGETNGLVRSMTEIQESTLNAGTSGVPGTDSNAEATNYNEIDGAGTEYQKASKTINYEMNETLTTVEKAEGQIKDITISVIIDESNLVDETLTEEQKNEIQDLVSAAAGLDTRVVQVSGQTFSVVEDPFADEMADAGIPWWIFAVVAGVIVSAIAGAVIFMRRRAKAEEEERIMRELEEQREIEEIRLEEADQSSPKYQIEKFIETNPEVVAQLLRAWLNED
jgi:flagellar M-ring protein FliF